MWRTVAHSILATFCNTEENHILFKAYSIKKWRNKIVLSNCVLTHFCGSFCRNSRNETNCHFAMLEIGFFYFFFPVGGEGCKKCDLISFGHSQYKTISPPLPPPFLKRSCYIDMIHYISGQIVENRYLNVGNIVLSRIDV